MLYFSKLKIVIIYFIIIFLSLFSLVNFISNEDNYLLDPTGDDWNDCGEDGLCDEDEEGYDLELNKDPSNDNWGSDNLNGTEGNSNWEEGEGT